MRKLSVFNSTTVHDDFTDMNGDMSWAHKDDPEWNAFVAENTSGGGLLLCFALLRVDGVKEHKTKRSAYPRRI